jgi:hypothetical protein
MELCKGLNVVVELIGMDELATDLYYRGHIIVRDYFGLSLSESLILSDDDFVKQYN